MLQKVNSPYLTYDNCQKKLNESGFKPPILQLRLNLDLDCHMVYYVNCGSNELKCKGTANLQEFQDLESVPIASINLETGIQT